MRFVLSVCLLLLPYGANARTAGKDVTVFAAASLTDALRDIAALWTQAGHQAPGLSFGSSSTLARQIEQGAPANIFASADLKWMDWLAEKQAIAADTRRNLLSNELVLVVPSDRPKTLTLTKGTDLLTILGRDGRLATGDPNHVAVGIYAEQALRTIGVWDQIAPRLARTEDVRRALLLVEHGEAPAGIVYATDAAISKHVVVAGIFPPGGHDPIVYPFAVTRAGDTAEARALLTFLSGPEARTVFVRRGFKVQ